ncbi:hypothetical protein D0X99_12365 [Algoriphagus lacus]|uniref:Uncharacterized protein n=1 Tax=Algoriphagus lacus TaxID=2056311 RepID=A0A418PRP4_9BACT|nr:hypothetical protein [Algoriphagus lacus]RIW15228.1 hypothetical protein D0X99_12365 [Algoriphagus lacus]
MKQIHPYSTFQEAIQSLDNGGSFFNLFSHSKDGVVSPAELGKVAGVSFDKQSLILFLVMSLTRLDNTSREKVLARLDVSLFKQFEKHQPVHMSIEQLAETGKPGMSATLVGTPKRIGSQESFGGMIMVPVIVGTVTSFTMIPMVNTYEVYELKSDYSEETVIVAHPKDQGSLPERKLRLGGVLTSLSQSEHVTHPDQVFLDIQYYMEEN